MSSTADKTAAGAPRGADQLVRLLAAAGVRRIFTLSGNHVMPVFDAALDVDIELVHVRHEAAAVHMADVWARLTGQPGVALVTGGPGHANAVSALYTARMADSPLVLLSGHAPNAQIGRGAFQEMAQADMAAPVTKASGTGSSARALAHEMAIAWRVALEGRPGPVHLSLPTDALEARVDGASLDEALAALAPAPMPLAAADADAIVARLRRAARPLVLAGPFALTPQGREHCARLEAALGIPVVGMESPRGVADPSLGAFAQMLAQADCVLLLAKRLDFTLKFGAVPAFAGDCEFMQIDPEEVERERARRSLGDRVSGVFAADAASACESLSNAAGKAGANGWADEVRAAIAYRPAAWDQAHGEHGRPTPAQALRPLQALLDSHPDAVLVADGGEIGQWAQACLNAPKRVVNGAAGAIGVGLPFAAAAALACPGAPVVAVMGDGSVGFHIAEFDTAVRYGIPYLAVVGNDARWNAEYQIQLKDYGPERLVGCELLPTRYDEVARGFGAHGELVTRADDVAAAAARARASGRVACLNLMIDGLAAPVVRRD